MPPGARLKLPFALPVQPVPQVIVMLAVGESVMVILLTCTFALLVMLPPTETVISSGLPLVTAVVQLLLIAKHPLGVGAQPLEPLLNQDAPLAGPVSVLPSGLVAEAWARLLKLEDIKFALKVPV